MTKKLLMSALAVLLILCSLAACAPSPEEEMLSEPVYVEMSVVGYGKVVLYIDPAVAPITASNFVNLVKDGFYDGLDFHRVQPGFMIQGGMPNENSKSLTAIKGEFASNGYQNTLSHTRGVISMARTNDPNSATSQFFICNADSTFLDGNYAAFGRVVEGMDVIDLITEETSVYANPYYNYVIYNESARAVIEYIRVLDNYTPSGEK